MIESHHPLQNLEVEPEESPDESKAPQIPAHADVPTFDSFSETQNQAAPVQPEILNQQLAVATRPPSKEVMENESENNFIPMLQVTATMPPLH